ncbi:MAG: SapC family protein, partial [Pseudomonadales bacterium]|nr:SapC family protein [Pseudomonadales bacterium]
MSRIYPLTKERYANQTWRLQAGLSFAAKDALVKLTLNELATALMSSYPLAFAGGAKAYLLVGVQGFDSGVNLRLGPGGKWLGAYVPKAYRCQPFLLGKLGETNRALCIDEDLALIAPQGGDAFYDETGALTPRLNDILKALAEFEQECGITERACALLEEFDLIEPWEIRVDKGQGSQGAIQ